MARVVISSVGVRDENWRYAEVIADDATLDIIEIRVVNSSPKSASVELSGATRTDIFSLASGERSFAIRSLKMKAVNSIDGLVLDGLLAIA